MHPKGIKALSAAEGGCATARLEQGSNPQPTRQKCKRPRMRPFSFWRWSESRAEDAPVQAQGVRLTWRFGLESRKVRALTKGTAG